LRTLLPKTPLPRTSSRLSSLKRLSTREDTADPIGSVPKTVKLTAVKQLKISG